MQSVLCAVWPYLAGGLLGWLLAGWLARKALAQQPATLERVVEKPIDNPKHLAQITELTAAVALLPALRDELRALHAAPPKVVETFIEIPVDRVVDRVVERVVEKIVEKPIDNPALLVRIRELTATAALLPALRNQIADLQTAPPKVLENVVEKIVVDSAGMLERDSELARWRQRIAELESQLRLEANEPEIDVAMAKAAGFKLKRGDDLEVIEGIGPKIAELLQSAGVHRFKQLSQMTTAQIQPILDAAGSKFKLAVPGTWPEQAALAASNQWHALKVLQEGLTAGLRK